MLIIDAAVLRIYKRCILVAEETMAADNYKHDDGVIISSEHSISKSEWRPCIGSVSPASYYRRKQYSLPGNWPSPVSRRLAAELP